MSIVRRATGTYYDYSRDVGRSTYSTCTVAIIAFLRRRSVWAVKNSVQNGYQERDLDFFGAKTMILSFVAFIRYSILPILNKSATSDVRRFALLMLWLWETRGSMLPWI
jgi:hypothetical protein